MSAGNRSKMYEQIGFLDPNTMTEGTVSQKIIFSQTLPQELSSTPQPQMVNSSSYNNNVPPFEPSTWDSTIHELQQQDVGFAINHQEHQQPNSQQFQVVTTHDFTLDPSYPSQHDFPTNQIQNTQNFQHSMELLGEFETIGQNTNTSCASSSVLLNDPLLQLNLPQQQQQHPQAINGGGIFQSLPHGFLFGGGDHEIMEGNVNGVLYHEEDVKNQLELDLGLLEFNTFTGSFVAKGKGSKHLPIEKQRREQLNGKFRYLRSLIPNPTKVDRASVVGDAIEYIRELIRTVNELKLLVEKKRIGRERCKRHKTTEEEEDNEGNKKPYGEKPADEYIRTSWLQRKSKESEVDVRIIDDEVTIKMVQRKNINFSLLFLTKLLDELHLDLHHLAGGHVGEFCTFFFNTKIIEGSSVYASAIANRVIEVMDTQHAATLPHSNS